MTTIEKIKKEFDYLHEVLASDRESYVWAINYIQDNIERILITDGYRLESKDRKILGKRADYLEQKLQDWELSEGKINEYMVDELSALRKIKLRGEVIQEITDAKVQR